MGNNLFGANISGKLAKSLGRKLPKGTLQKSVQGTRDANNLAAGRQDTTTSHKFRGFISGLAALRKDTILPDARDAVFVLGDTVIPRVTPVVGDRILIQSTTFTIVNVSTDPDAATHTCQVK